MALKICILQTNMIRVNTVTWLKNVTVHLVFKFDLISLYFNIKQRLF